MKLYVIHTCNVSIHGIPLRCHCHAVEGSSGQLTFMCRDKPSVLALDSGDTVYGVPFACSGSKGYYDVTRLEDAAIYSPNNRS